MPHLPEAIRQVLAAFAPLFSARVWRHAQVWLLGAILGPQARTVTAALRVMGLVRERHFTNDHRVLNRATWSARQGSRILLGGLITRLVPLGAPIIFGADDTVERRAGRQIRAKWCYRDAGRSTKKHVIHVFGLKWGSLMLLVPVPWSRRVWALPFLTALCWPPENSTRRRHKTSVDWVRQMMKQWRRLLPGHRLVMVVAGGFAAGGVSNSLHQKPRDHGLAVALGRRLVSAPGPQLPGTRGPKPTNGKRHRSLQAWAERSDTPWETMEVDGYGGQRKQLWGFSRTALWYIPGLPPVAIRYVRVADPEGQLRMEAFFCADLEATPVEILPGVVMRWAVEVTFEESRTRLGLETQRLWSDQAIARTTPVLLALFSLVTVLALRVGQDGRIPLPVTAWYRKAEPTFADCLAVLRRHLWRAQYVVNSAPEAEIMQFPRELRAVGSLHPWHPVGSLIGQSRDSDIARIHP